MAFNIGENCNAWIDRPNLNQFRVQAFLFSGYFATVLADVIIFYAADGLSIARMVFCALLAVLPWVWFPMFKHRMEKEDNGRRDYISIISFIAGWGALITYITALGLGPEDQDGFYSGASAVRFAICVMSVPLFLSYSNKYGHYTKAHFVMTLLCVLSQFIGFFAQLLASLLYSLDVDADPSVIPMNVALFVMMLVGILNFIATIRARHFLGWQCRRAEIVQESAVNAAYNQPATAPPPYSGGYQGQGYQGQGYQGQGYPQQQGYQQGYHQPPLTPPAYAPPPGSGSKDEQIGNNYNYSQQQQQGYNVQPQYPAYQQPYQQGGVPYQQLPYQQQQQHNANPNHDFEYDKRPE